MSPRLPLARGPWSLHARIAADDLVMGLADSDTVALADVPFGVAALMTVEDRFSGHVLDRWHRGRSSLWSPGPGGTHSADRSSADRSNAGQRAARRRWRPEPPSEERRAG